MSLRASTYRKLKLLSMIVVLMFGTLTFGDALLIESPDGQDAVAQTATLSMEAGVDYVSAYWWQGYLYENNGLIVQPHVELGVPLRDADEDGPAIDLYFGWWNSLHSAQTDANVSSMDSWYETDLYGGVTLDFDAFYFDLIYTFYLYPNNSDFDAVQEAGITLGWYPDTSTAIGWLLGEPSVSVFLETCKSNVGNVGDRTSYAKIDFGPSMVWIPDKATVSFPVSVGLSIESFYEDDAGNDVLVGFVSLGIDLELPLSEHLGAQTTLNVGATGLILSDNVQEVNGTQGIEGYLYANLNFAF